MNVDKFSIKYLCVHSPYMNFNGLNNDIKRFQELKNVVKKHSNDHPLIRSVLINVLKNT